jgi:hypothetical protein
MNFKKRILYYSSGFIIGLVFVFLIFGTRRCEWLPERRVINFILEHPIKINKQATDTIKNIENFSRKIHTVLIHGDVDFSKSETKGPIKVYHFSHEQNHLNIAVSFNDSLSQLCEVNKTIFSNEPTIDIDAASLYIDRLNFFELISEKDKKLTKEFKCKIVKLGISSTDYYKSFNATSVSINWEVSRPFLDPNPYYIGIININQENYGLLFEQGSEKIRMKNIIPINEELNDQILTSLLSEFTCDQ